MKKRFCLELVAANPALLNIQKLGVDMEAAIFNGFKSVLIGLAQLLCTRHLQQRDVLAIENCQKKSNLSDKTKEQYKNEILWDLYGKRTGEIFEKRLADSVDSDDFSAKLLSLQPRWKKLCPGFYAWFTGQRKSQFISSVIQSARAGTSVSGLYYQNDIESQHARQKRIQNFKLGSVVEAVNTISALMEQEENEEVLALYSPDKYVLASSYKSWFTSSWWSWSPDRREQHIQNFRRTSPSIESSFVKPLNAGRKPNYRRRQRLPEAIDVVERHVPSTLPSLVQPSSPAPSTTSTTLLQTTSGNTSTSTVPVTQVQTSSAISISFEDPRASDNNNTVFELHLKALLKGEKNIKVCRGNCKRPIHAKDLLIVCSYETYTWRDAKPQEEVSK